MTGRVSSDNAAALKLTVAVLALGSVVWATGTIESKAAEQASAVRPTMPAEWAKALEWRCIGPANMGGRITALAVYEKDPSTWWAATASGGLLKTTNNGITFEHQFDKEATVSIGDVAVSQQDPNVVWVGTGEGNPRNSSSWGDGVYKSTDGGKTWKRMGLEKTFQTGAIAIHPENHDIVFVAALGRLWGPNKERGLYRTRDGGKTWERVLYVNQNTGAGDVQFCPNDPDTMLATTYERRRDIYDSNEPKVRYGKNNGVWKSTDGGETWRRITKGLPSARLGNIGLAYYRKDPSIVYAVIESEQMGQEPKNAPYAGLRAEDADAGARVTEVTRRSPAEKAGLKTGDVVIAVDGARVHSNMDMLREFRSREAGDVVTVEVSRERKSLKLEMELATRPRGATDGAGAGRRTGGLGPGYSSDPRTGPFSAMLGGQVENMQQHQGPEGHEHGGVYLSTDGGERWKRINSVNPRPMYFSEVRVDPSDNQHLFVLGVSLHRSKDGGDTFTSDGARDAHPDHHALWINPRDGRHMILGNDGGLYVTYDRGDRWDHLNHAAIGQFYHVAVDSRRNYRVYGGLQDNGSWGGPSRSRDGGGPINQDWINIGGGDGFVCRVDPDDPDQVYYESQNGGMGRFNLRTGERGSIRPRADRTTRPRFNWKTPFILSAHNPRVYYTAGNFAFRSLKKGDELKKISPELPRTREGTATALAESPRNADVLYVGTDDGFLWVTRDGGVKWEQVAAFKKEAPARSEAESSRRERPAEEEAGAPATEGDRDARSGGDRDSSRAEARPRRRPPAAVEEEERPEGEDDRPAAPRRRPSAEDRDEGAPRPFGGAMMDRMRRMDADGDGKIQKDEVPDRLLPMFERLDSNRDDAIDEKELAEAAERMRAFSGGAGDEAPERRPQRRGAGGDSDARGYSDDPPADEPAPRRAERGRRGEDTAEERQPAPRGRRRAPAQDSQSSDRGGEAPAQATEPGAPAMAAADDPITGEWSARLLSDQMPAGANELKVILKMDSQGRVSGRSISPMGEAEIIDGRFRRQTGRLTFTVDRSGMTIDFTARLVDGKLEGEADVGGGMMSFEFEAERINTDVSDSSAAAPASAASESEDDRAAARPLAELLPGPRWVSSVEPSRAADGRVYATFDGHRCDDDEPYVMMSEDYGKTWRSIRANLPTSAGSTRVLREDVVNPNILYLGTEFGAWVSIDRGRSWTRLDGSFPTVAVHEFAIHPTSGEVVVATHGRSIWVMDAAPLRQLSDEATKAGARLYKPATAVYWRPLPNRGSAGSRRFVGQNPASGARIYYSLQPGVRGVSLKIVDGQGETVRDLEVSNEAGLHRATWDLRRAPEGPPVAARGGAGGRGEAGGLIGSILGGRGARGGAGAAGGGRGGQGGRGGAAGRAGQGGGGPGGFRGAAGRLVPSGEYWVVLKANGETFRQPLNVETDPEYPEYRAWEMEAQEAMEGEEEETELDGPEELDSAEGIPSGH